MTKRPGQLDPSAAGAGPPPRYLEVPGVGPCLLLAEFAIFTGELGELEAHDAREDPDDLLLRLADGRAIVLTGAYRYVDAVYRYCQHFERRLVRPEEVPATTDRARRRAALTEARRRKLHHLLLVARGEGLANVEDHPDLAGLQEWLAAPTGEEPFLIPVRRLQRILTDRRRAAEGLSVPGLGATITLLPHVYVPGDQSVPGMFAEYGALIRGRRVLDMGTGTGVLALLAARLGAASVVATDINPQAVANARLNVERLGLGGLVDVRDASDLFAAVPGEVFDLILFNAPWIQGEPRTLYDTGLYDPGYRVLDGFLAAAPAHLAPAGVILLQYSDVSRTRGDDSIAHLEAAVEASGLAIVSSPFISRVSRILGERETVFVFEIRRAGEGD